MTIQEDYNQILIDQAHLLADASEAFGEMVENLKGLFDDMKINFKNKDEEEEKDFNNFMRYSKRIKEYISHVHKEIPSLKDAIKNSEKELQECKKNVETLERDLSKQKEITEEYFKISEDCKKELDQSQEVMKEQAAYSAALGSVLGTMLWKTSKDLIAIETFIESGILNQFLNLANTTIIGFRQTYNTDLPNSETYEFKFLLSLLGIYTNLAAQSIGRDFILQRENGMEFIKTSLEYLGEIPAVNGALIKNLILMLVYNLSINKRAAPIIVNLSEKGIENIFLCFNENHPANVQQLALRLITTLLTEIPRGDFQVKVRAQLSQWNFDHLKKSTDENTKIHFKKFIEKIQDIIY